MDFIFIGKLIAAFVAFTFIGMIVADFCKDHPACKPENDKDNK